MRRTVAKFNATFRPGFSEASCGLDFLWNRSCCLPLEGSPPGCPLLTCYVGDQGTLAKVNAAPRGLRCPGGAKGDKKVTMQRLEKVVRGSGEVVR